MKNYFLAIIAWGALLATISGCEIFDDHTWTIDDETATLLHLINGEVAQKYPLNFFDICVQQNLVFKDTITLDNGFYSTQCVIQPEKIEDLTNVCPREFGPFEIRKAKFRGEYVYTISSWYEGDVHKTVSFEFTAEQVYFKKDGQPFRKLPPLQIKKDGKTWKEYVPCKTDEDEHVRLHIPLAVFLESSGKKLSNLPIVFDVVRTNESVWNAGSPVVGVHVTYNWQED
ncbi:MAG: hypothetical protein IJS26_00780 [Alphaproteobacteria bacterium]|nr:hypothetical protein [Alphaproteobacteria bacterium]